MDYVGRFVGSNAAAKSPTATNDGATGGNDATTTQTSSAASSHRNTSTRWSILSERVQGLLAEAHAVGAMTEGYCLEMSDMEGPAMRAVRVKMMSTDWPGEWEAERTMFAYGEEMSTDPLEAMFLKAIVTMKSPRRVLEVGMFTGYGAAAMLEGCAGARVVSLEIDPYLKTWVGECLQGVDDASEEEGSCYASRHSIVVGPALDTLPSLPVSEPFDLVFVDANKSEYRRYVEILMERGLLAPGCQILADNTLYCGIPYTDPLFDAQPARRAFGEAIREFNLW
eukprot:CAMPEP_0172499056 /NCGR_PEP_ID=MMETSP1066-20121228/121487_1 /TAXON_ID=671091 /ORGANISM="Coscinodiscus wailesii, Strain CCMP2513" /LENGTH=281 /DNA_ID=CAMNT_0013272603 /DNA_START=137 /DNA_END=979 /DNA_ORIENTATION=+